MRTQASQTNTSLMDWVRPGEADGPLLGAVFATYALSQEPDFFGRDFLPTLLGLGAVRDRGYASSATVERMLAAAEVSLICDAHALATGVRPTLRVDVVPMGHRVHHAKIVLIHRQNLIRLMIGSANLTDEGFRRWRETVAVLDFHEGGHLRATVLMESLKRWRELLGEAASPAILRAFDAASLQAKRWRMQGRRRDGFRVEVVFGGGRVPLWRQVVDAWPTGEPVQQWVVCSPFWPRSNEHPARNPFEVIAAALAARGASLANCELEVIARASAPGKKALPVFPFALVRHLRRSGFPVRRGHILPAQWDAAPDETPDGKASERRDLHAKWIVLAGPQTVLALVGSANFTRRGLGTSENSAVANVEAGVLMRWPRRRWKPETWRPPIRGQVVDWAACGAGDVCAPIEEPETRPLWPDFIQSVELAIHWDKLPEPAGELFIQFRETSRREFHITLPDEPATILQPAKSGVRFALASAQVATVLARRVVEVVWDGGQRRAWFPVNIRPESKAALPAVLGAKPSEEQLLAYFHGHVSEEDLLARLEQQAQQVREASTPPPPESAEEIGKLKDLQNYVVREFVESLYGLARMIRDASMSPRAAQQALLGDLSPVSLAEQVVHACTTGKRTPTAAAFQLVELLRVVGEIEWSSTIPARSRGAFEAVRRRTMKRLLALAEQAAVRPEFAAVMGDLQFVAYVRSALPERLAARWLALARRRRRDATTETAA